MPRPADPAFAHIAPAAVPKNAKRKPKKRQAHEVDTPDVKRYTAEVTAVHRAMIARLVEQTAAGLWRIKAGMLALAAENKIPPITARRVQTLYERHVTESRKQFEAQLPNMLADCVNGLFDLVARARSEGRFTIELQARNQIAELTGMKKMQPLVGLTVGVQTNIGGDSPTGLSAAPPDILEALRERLLPESPPAPPSGVLTLVRTADGEVVSPGKRTEDR